MRRTLAFYAAVALLAPRASWPMPAPGDFGPTDPTVNESSGAAQFRVPLAVPPGPGGHQPNLALAYSSQAGDGAIGVGWRLDMGEVRCSVRFGVPIFQSCQQFELNGQLLTGPDQSGNYHTLIETFQRIQFVPSPSGKTSWIVTRTDGTRWIYGNNENGRVRVGNSMGQPIARWLLTEIVDASTNGNEIIVTYDRTDQGTAYPSVVSYASGARQLEFFYETRPDPIHDFAGGIERFITQRLREIQVTTSGNLYYRLALGYTDEQAYTTHRSRLAWVQRLGSDCTDLATVPAVEGPNCSALPREEFDYGDPADQLAGAGGGPGVQGAQWALDPSWSVPSGIYLSALVPPYGKVKLADVDGDGLPDLVRAVCALAIPGANWPCTDPSDGVREVYLNTGSGWENTPDPLWSNALASLTWEAPMLTLATYPQDLPPFVTPKTCSASSSTYTSGVFFDTGLLLLRDTALAVREYQPGWSFWEQDIGAEPDWQLVDINGDGRADLVTSVKVGGAWIGFDCDPVNPTGDPINPPTEYHEATTSVVFLNTGSGWAREPSLEGALPPFSSMEIQDFTGLGACSNNGWVGEDTVNNPPTDEIYDPCREVYDFFPRYADLTGDGRLDVLVLVPTDSRYIVKEICDGTPCDDARYYNPAQTLAYVQWKAPNGSYIWLRAPMYDLVDPNTNPPTPLHHMHLHFVAAQQPYYPLTDYGFAAGDDGFRFADVNRDGLTDVLWNAPDLETGVEHANGPPMDKGVLINTGSGWCWSGPGDPCEDALASIPPEPFVRALNWGEASVQIAAGALMTAFEGTSLTDVNGDGILDTLRVNTDCEGNNTACAWLASGGAGGAYPGWVEDDYWFRAPQDVAVIRDLDGDGAADLITASGEVHRSQSSLPDLIVEKRNGRGGVVSVEYAAAVTLRDPALEGDAAADAAQLEPEAMMDTGISRWHPAPVVSTVTVAGPNRVTATSAYTYARPRWCPVHNSWLGYRAFQINRPDGSDVVSYFYQHHGRAGRPSGRTVLDGGEPRWHESFVWDLANPATVEGAWAGDAASEPVYLVRVSSSTRGAEYGTFVGESTGSLHQEDYYYNDTYGFNFLSQIDSTSPASGLVTTYREPYAADLLNWIVGKIEERRVETLSPAAAISRSVYAYTPSGKLQSRTEDIARRDATGPATETAVTQFFYDTYDNLSRTVDAENRETKLCYDGDTATGWTCPSPSGQNTHSVLVGILDPLGNVIAIEPDPASGETLEVASPYTDEPTILTVPDPHGRPAEIWVTPDGTPTAVRQSEFIYHDADPTPYIEELTYIDEGGAEYVRTAIFGDGFGDVWKTVNDVDPGQSGAKRYAGLARYIDPVSRQRFSTAPIACGTDPKCSTLTGYTETPVTAVTSDALGRPVYVDSPDGVSVSRYSAGLHPIAAGPVNVGQDVVDEVLSKNAKGDLTLIGVDGSLQLFADSCDNTLPAGTQSLEGESCVSGERTLYGYDADRQLAVVYDPRSTELSDWSDPAHQLRYVYDTLGRSVEIQDPDAGLSSMIYDRVGNLKSATNARGQIRGLLYDDLDRLYFIDAPSGASYEWDLTINYDPLTRRRAGVTSTDSYSESWGYDGFGRVEHNVRSFAGTTLIMDFEYDLLDRPTKITYPTTTTVVTYDYDGAYLKGVCPQGDYANCDTSTSSTGFLISDVDYDDVGRRENTYTRAGTLQHSYYTETDQPTGRRVQALKQAAIINGPSAGAYDFRYMYDQIGNITQIQDGQTAFAENASATYQHDSRNRLESWTWTGSPGNETFYFAYDDLGNLVGRDLPQPPQTPSDWNQLYQHATNPHAVTQNHLGESYDYDPDGNLIQRGQSKYYTYDSANRPVCVGQAPGWCDVGNLRYDLDGNLLYDSSGNARILVGDFFEWIPASNKGYAHYFAFGDRIAYEQDLYAVLRTTWTPFGWSFETPGEPLQWLGGAAWLGSFLLILVWAGPGAGLRDRPATASLVLILTGLLIAPPQAWAMGAGGSAQDREILEFSDHLGSNVYSAWNNGTAKDHRVYEPFGRTIAGQSADRFAGHPYEGGNGLYYMKARWYDAESGRFASVDPIADVFADPAAVNGYAYVRNNPLSFVDPDGREVFGITFGINFSFGPPWLGVDFTGSVSFVAGRNSLETADITFDVIVTPEAGVVVPSLPLPSVFVRGLASLSPRISPESLERFSPSVTVDALLLSGSTTYTRDGTAYEFGLTSPSLGIAAAGGYGYSVRKYLIKLIRALDPIDREERSRIVRTKELKLEVEDEEASITDGDRSDSESMMPPQSPGFSGIGLSAGALYSGAFTGSLSPANFGYVDTSCSACTITDLN